MGNYVSEAVIHRLPGYYRHLRDLEKAGVQQISSQELGERMHQTPSQIRQDINCFGGFGRQGYGYRVSELKDRIGEILGIDQEHKVIIIGAGSIGRAVAHYPSFSREGFRFQAMFDVDPAKIGTQIDGIPVYSMDDLDTYLQNHEVDITVLSLPGQYAQETLQHLEARGVQAVWNFAPIDLQYSTDKMVVVNVHLSDSLQVLSYKMKHRDDQ